MRKNLLYMVLAIVTSFLLFTTGALCNQCSAGESLLSVEEEPSEEYPPEEEPAEEEPPGEEPPEEEPPEEEPPEEEPLEEEPAEEEPTEEGPVEEELIEPTIELEIYEGPLYSEADMVCYYRIEAKITGNPTPIVEFSKDDSSGAWGSRKCQINIEEPSETYTLTATATNSEGTASDSLAISWGCEVVPEEEPPDETPEVNEKILHPSDIGYIVYPSGINTDTAIIGDSISNTDVRGFFAFNLSSLAGYELVSFKLKLKTAVPWNDSSLKGDIILYNRTLHPWLPTLSSDDYLVDGNFLKSWSDSDTVEFYTTADIDFLEFLAETGKKLQFMLFYELDTSNGDHKIDGREYTKDSVTLTIEYME